MQSLSLISTDDLRAIVAEVTARPALPTLLTREQLANELSVSTATLDRHRREGLPCIMVGDAPRFQLPGVILWYRVRAAKEAVRRGDGPACLPAFVAAEAAE